MRIRKELQIRDELTLSHVMFAARHRAPFDYAGSTWRVIAVNFPPDDRRGQLPEVTAELEREE